MPGVVQVSSLAVRDFRCFGRAAIGFHPSTTFLVGANAQGKTSLLEAVSVLLRLQSPRTTKLAHAVRHGAQGLVVDGYCAGRHLQFYYSTKRRKLALDSVVQSRSHEYLGAGRVVYMANDDIRMVRDGADHRRKYLDFVGSQTLSGYRRVLREFSRVLRARNRLLKTGGYAARRELPAFTECFVELAWHLETMRATLVGSLAPHAMEAHAGIAGGAGDFSLSYAPGSGGDLPGRLRESRDDEARLGQTLAGPHRDDLQIALGGMAAEKFASEGQQRTIALALRMAEAAWIAESADTPPILLIDDIFGELDKTRRNRLLACLPAESQKMVTATHLDWADDQDNALIYRIGGGLVREG